MVAGGKRGLHFFGTRSARRNEGEVRFELPTSTNERTNMKNQLLRNKRGLLMVLALAAFFVVGGASQSWAHDRDGFWDRHHHYHHYGYYHHHRGYWDDRNGVRLWINI